MAQLAKLADMKNAGILSDAEFAAAKAIEDRGRIASVQSYLEDLTKDTRWAIVSVTPREDNIIYVVVKGTPPLPDVEEVYAGLEAEGLEAEDIVLEFIPPYTYDVDGERDHF